LPPFPELFARREEGPYGGRVLPFLGLPDLIRSKETERDSDWQDVETLEELLDARRFAAAAAGAVSPVEALSDLRTRRGLERWLQAGRLADAELLCQAVARARRAVTLVYLLPFAPADVVLPQVSPPLEAVVLARLRTGPPASPRHLVLADLMRRRYKDAAQAADRADKQAILAAQRGHKP
jgi:hypothetical protein